MKKLSTLLVAAALALPLLSGAVQAQTLKLAGQYGYEADDTKDMESFKKALEEQGEGKVKVRLFPANQLGDYTQVYEELRRGSIEMALITVPSQFDKQLDLPYLPYLAKNWDEAREIYSSESVLFDMMAEANLALGVRLLAFQPAAFGGLGLTKLPANSIKDVATNKSDVLVRVPPMEVFAVPIEDNGFKTVSIPWSDTYAALQSGVADGWSGGSAILNYEAMRDVIKYYVPINNWFDVRAWLISERAWKKLSPSNQEKIQQLARDYAEQRLEANEQVEKDFIKKLADAGVTIVELSEAELDAYASQAREKTWPKLEAIYGQEAFDKLRK